MLGRAFFGIAAAVLLSLGASAANLEQDPGVAQSPPGPPDWPPPALADRDKDGLSDGLQAKLAAAAPGERFDVVVTFKRPGKGGAPLGNAASAQAAVGPFQLKREFQIIPGFAATMTAAQARALANVAGVFRIEEDFEVRRFLNDSRLDMGIDRIQFGAEPIVDGGGFPATGQGVVICMLDTGIDVAHEMFAGGNVIDWFDVINGQLAAYDDNGHGTHTAGIAAGGQGTYQSQPIMGTAWEADIVGVKVLNSGGSGTESQVIAGIDYCALHGLVDILSMSFGGGAGGDCQDAMAQAARAAVTDHGKTVVAAAGNSGPGLQTIPTPACGQEVIAVGASSNILGDPLGTSVVAFSGRGPVPAPGGSYIKPDIVYPGTFISSAKVGTFNDYWALSGTSMATPGAAGLAALALQVNPTLTPGQLKALMEATAHDFGDPGKDYDWGAGLAAPYTFVAKAKDPLANPTATPYQSFSLETASVPDGGQWYSELIEVTAADVAAGVPIAVVVTIDGTPRCSFGYPDLYCDWGLVPWEYYPDLDVQLHRDNGAPVAANSGDITLSECILNGEWCGVVKGAGRQETLRYTPVQEGFLKVRVFSFDGAGAFRVERWHRLSDAAGPPPGGNTAPQVNAGADATIDEGGTFTSSGSFTDPDADTWSATVDYGDGSGAQPLSLNADKSFSLNHVYADSSSHTVTVTVDDGTDTGQDTALVTVNNVTPQVNAGPDAAINEGDTFAQSGSFTDPGADTWTATVNYGDGSVAQPLSLNPDKTFSLSHPYTSAAGSPYTVTVTVDDGTAAGSDTVIVTVNAVGGGNTAPVVDAGPDAAIDEGGTFASSGAFTDPDADTWSATVNYGDGSGAQPLSLNPDKTFGLSHVYADNGLYTVTVTVNDGTDTGQDTALVTVNNVAPQLNAGPDATINEGDTFASSGSFTDPGSDVWTATVDYGDGSGVQPLALAGKTFSLSHPYTSAADSPYTVTVTVNDGAAAGSDTVIVTVLPVSGGIGRIKGTVKDSSGSKVQSALVEIQAQAISTTTNKGGKYNLRDVPAGSHTLKVSKNGCIDYFAGVTVVDGNTLTVDVVLTCS